MSGSAPGSAGERLGEVEAFFRRLQERLRTELEALEDTARFGRDAWRREGGGGGVTRVLEDGAVFERAAVNFSAVWGEVPPGFTERLAAGARRFRAAGVSLIVHPRNPYVPAMHANVRHLATDTGEAWFGGGADLTPCYLDEADAAAFHRVLQDVCARHDVADYERWKAWCDRYFTLPHRGERRGIGGIFFDRLEDPHPEAFAFVRDLGVHLLDAYVPIVRRRRDTPFGEREERWQLLRRGRYAEFNLLVDRGTRFGIETGGRAESILVSLPPRARWAYDVEPEPGTPERRLLDVLRAAPRRWVPPS